MSEASWADFDHTAACLDALRTNSAWIEQHCARIQHAITVMRAKPSFATGVADDLERAKEALSANLALIKAALDEFDRKPFLQAAE